MVFHQFTFPRTVYRTSLSSTSSPTLVISCLFDDSPSNNCEVISHCDLDLHFPEDQWCPSTFSCNFWPFVCLFWENVYSVLLPFLNWTVRYFPFALGCMSSLYILDINPLSDIIYHLNRERGERALMGKQTAFRKDKWALRRIAGRCERCCDKVCLGEFLSRSQVTGVRLLWLWNPQEGIYDMWILLGGSAFRQIRGSSEKGLLLHLLILKYLQLKIILRTQW